LKGIYKTTLFLLAVIVLAACSRKKDTFLSRNFHAVTAEYNTLYNGNLAFEDGKEGLAASYRDNFWEILPVERIDLDENATLPGESKNPNFNRAEEKAAKAIQKHSVYVNNKEHNPQIDEAYMLLGKARYYDGRFIPSLDAFNFILDRYPTSNNITNANVWKAKANIRLNNEEVALENLQELLEDVEREKIEMDEEELADVAAIMAEAYVNMDSIPEALPYMKIASENVEDNELKGRYNYIKGQLYNRIGERDSANMAFDQVIELNRKAPRVYMINAYIAKARNFDYDNEDKTAFLELLNELAEDRENRPYLDKIYNQIGEYYYNLDSIDTAVKFYNKSIQEKSQDRTLQSKNYETLAIINFDATEYKAAGAYYDSTLTNLEENTKKHRRIKKKRENLDDVIKYEDIAIKNDSILRFVNMTEGERLAYFTNYTTKLKEKAIADSLARVKEQQSIANNEFYQKNTNSGGPSNEGSTFYFYNPTTVAYGKQEFNKIWGDRKLEDNWRRSDKQTSLIEEEDAFQAEAISDNERFDPQTYIAKIPTDQKVIDSLAGDRNFAYYQLGLIYKEKFKEYGLATERLEKLLTFNPEDRLILPSKYNLYKIYSEMENESLATQYKNDIITNHPDSRYAEILRNPNTALATDESSPEFKYKQLYKDFEASKYEHVIEQSDAYISQYTGTEIVPKFELLKATAIARQQGFEAYKKALNFIALNYPNSKEGQQAEFIYGKTLRTIESSDFLADEEAKSWKVVYKFDSTETEAAQALKDKLVEAIDAYRYTNMSASLDYYTPQTKLVVIHGLNTKTGGRNFAQVLKENKEFKIKKPSFEISTPNYKIIQIHKNLDTYLNNENEPVE
jgi:tetratricopeptide (TPR) repeat protein|tara:strand:+ start:3841 stop:6399 length:2559 start_codon:yes stop_codon:yes gene_type:complete